MTLKRSREAHARMVYLITGLSVGGAETQLVRVARELTHRGWEVTVVSLLPPQAYVADLERAGIHASTLGMSRRVPDPRAIIRLARLLQLSKPHILHSYMFHANILARVTRLFVEVPVLISSVRTLHEQNRWREVLYRLTDSLCDVTTHVCRTGAERYVRIGAVPARKMRHIPNGVDTDVFRPDPVVRVRLRSELGVEGSFVWLAVGRFEPPKDHPTMLQAFANIAHNHPNSLLLLVGDGPLRREIEAMASALGIQSRVRFLGLRQDISHLMNVADAYLMSSSREGLPNVLLEAHSTGLPIVATDVGGNREVVLDGKTGFIVPSRNPDALAQAMQRMMDLDESERSQMGVAGRQHIIQNYSMEHVVQQWEDLYRELLSQKGVQITLKR